MERNEDESLKPYIKSFEEKADVSEHIANELGRFGSLMNAPLDVNELREVAETSRQIADDLKSTPPEEEG